MENKLICLFLLGYLFTGFVFLKEDYYLTGKIEKIARFFFWPFISGPIGIIYFVLVFIILAI